MIARSLFRATDRFLLSRLRARGYRSENIPTRFGSIHLLRAKGDGIHPPVVVLHGLAAASHFYENVFDPMRPFVRSVIERFRPQTIVMSQNEIHPKAKIRTLGQV